MKDFLLIGSAIVLMFVLALAVGINLEAIIRTLLERLS